MPSAAVYGLLLGLTMVLQHRIAPQPLGAIVMWGLFTAQLTVGAIVCWRRTGLPFITAAMAISASMGGLLLVAALVGRVYPDIPVPIWFVFGMGLGASLTCLVTESFVHRAAWDRWKAHAERQNIWAVLTLRHIPHLRTKGV